MYLEVFSLNIFPSQVTFFEIFDREMICSCNSVLIDYFTWQNLSPGKCDSTSYSQPSHSLSVKDERRIFENDKIIVPYETCLDSNYYRAIFEFKWLHENATIQLYGSNTFVRT